jgi:hypothetical protein
MVMSFKGKNHFIYFYLTYLVDEKGIYIIIIYIYIFFLFTTGISFYWSAGLFGLFSSLLTSPSGFSMLWAEIFLSLIYIIRYRDVTSWGLNYIMIFAIHHHL